jgi:DNA-directed RNA polymerase alpha subunit
MPATRGGGRRKRDELTEALGLISDVVTLVLMDQESTLSDESRMRLSTLARTTKEVSARLEEQRAAKAHEGEDTDGVDFLRIGSRLTKTFQRAGIHRVDRLREMSDREILAVHGIGPQSLTMVRWALEDHAHRWWEYDYVVVSRRAEDPLPRWWERDDDASAASAS